MLVIVCRVYEITNLFFVLLNVNVIDIYVYIYNVQKNSVSFILSVYI
jgi:hypothetical protein